MLFLHVLAESVSVTPDGSVIGLERVSHQIDTICSELITRRRGEHTEPNYPLRIFALDMSSLEKGEKGLCWQPYTCQGHCLPLGRADKLQERCTELHQVRWYFYSFRKTTKKQIRSKDSCRIQISSFFVTKQCSVFLLICFAISQRGKNGKDYWIVVTDIFDGVRKRSFDIKVFPIIVFVFKCIWTFQPSP